MKTTKRSLLFSALSLLLCFLILLGTTFAWFTDKVEVTGNVIKAGNLDIEMYWSDKPTGPWTNLETSVKKTIFDYDKWEPGYTDVKYIKIVNEGSLALNYEFAITPETAVGKLAEVIQVYYADEAVTLTDRGDVQNLTSIGFLKTALEKGTIARGTLMAEGQQNPTHPQKEVVYTLAMSMLTSAGNEYQGEEAGKFTITALASQAMYEKDSFGDDYDAKAVSPVITIGTSVSGAVTVNNGVVAQKETLVGKGVSAIIPAGVALENGVDRVTVTATPLDNSASGITPVNQYFIPVDIHATGVAENNTVPLIINLGAVMPKNLNLGNYTIYHVENGVTNTMTLVNSEAELTAHNNFTYDPLTGSVSIAMKSFSEVTLLAEENNVWNGNVATGFAKGDGDDNPYIIANADQLAYLNDRISNDNANYAEKNYKLFADITFSGNGENIFYPIGYQKLGEGNNGAPEAETWYTYGGSFRGVFDGNGHTISGIYQNTWAMNGDYDHGYYNDAMGLFGYVNGGIVKNLCIDNFYSEGEFAPTGCVAAYGAGASTFENILITNSHPQTYNTSISCIVGYDNGDGNSYTFNNITVDDTNIVSALWGSWDVGVSGILGRLKTASVANFNNCYVSATMDAYNDVCGNYQYYWYRYTGAFIGTVDKKNATNANKISLDNVSATNCYADFGTRHDYYYCELVANTKASYTHDHQMSRLTQVKAVDLENKQIIPLVGEAFDIPDTGRYNYVVVNGTHGTENAVCYHFVNGKQHEHDVADADNEEVYEMVNGVQTLREDKQCVYIPYRQLFGGYGWGTDGYDLGEYSSITKITDVTTAEEKFDPEFAHFVEIENNEVLALTKFFKAMVDSNKINMENVQVTISPVGDSTVVGDYIINKTDWTQSTISFKNTGFAQIIINDYNMCKPASVTVKVISPDNNENGEDDGWGDAGDW